MTVLEIERAARDAALNCKKCSIPGELNLLESHLYIALYSVYKAYDNSLISKEEGSEAKQVLIAKYNTRKDQYEREEDIHQKMIQSIVQTDGLRVKLNKQIMDDDSEGALITALLLVELYSGIFVPQKAADV